jgi:nicotinate-nucleotide adenylyltransferase
MNRVGLYGGSFDPVHLGHLLVAEAALEEFSLDRLIVIPAAQSPFKPTSTPSDPNLRLRMLRLAFAGMNRVQIDDQEIRRGGISYSVDTAADYARQYPAAALCWLIGADHVRSLPSWREAHRLSALVEFVVIPRPGVEPTPPPAGFRLHFLRGFPLALSASEIRSRAREGRSLRHLVPSPVAEVIESEKLYR